MVVYLFTYLSIVVFCIAVIARIIKISKTPLHLRWEIYPVAHEAGDKASYGGSYLEEQNWWEKPRKTSFINMMKVQLPEMFFLTAVRENNKSLWYRSFPFHFGLYLIGTAVFLLLASFIPGIGGVAKTLAIVSGFTGLLLGLVGAIGLLIGRLTMEDYAGYTSGADFVNLYLFISAFTIALISHLFIDPGFTIVREFLKNLMTFNVGAPLRSNLVAFEIVVFSFMLAYIPLTHMAHFFVKYFTYHDIRWNDEPNIRGGKFEKDIQKVLAYRVTWSAPHIKGEGRKSWSDVATEDIEK